MTTNDKYQKFEAAEKAIIDSLNGLSFGTARNQILDQLTLLEADGFNIGNVTELLISVFNAGRETGKNELKKRIAYL